MTKHIAIVANYNKTLFFKKIADRLEAFQSEENGISVFWVCVSKIWYDHLIAYGVEKSKILYLPRSIIQYKKDDSYLSYKLNELIYSDRVFRHEPAFGEKYLLAFQSRVREFILTNHISYIFSECTWAHEILLNRMCLQEAELNCRFLKPHTIRIPNQRFAFFEDEFENQLHEIKTGEEKDWEFELKKPDYFHLNDQKNQLSTRIFSLAKKIKLALSAEKHDREDPTQRLSRTRFFASKILGEINYYIYKLFVKTKKLNELPSRFWVYYLHKQPEASIDVVGRYSENQYENILRLTKSLPDGCHLLIKEHSNAIGDRSYRFYQAITELNRVHLIDERIDSFSLIERAEKTVTVSGTVAYEAGLLNKPTLIFSDVFYSTLPSIDVVGERKALKRENIADFKRYVYKHSFPGIISDPILNDPECISMENVELVSNAFKQVIHHD